METADLPLEMIEEILLTLPAKFLLRFSSVSKLWNSTISEPRFTRKYKSRRAAAVDRARLVVYMKSDAKVNYLHALSSISSNPLIDIEIDVNIEADVDCIFSDISGHFDRQKTYLRGFCDELWLVECKGSLFLWNPSMRSKGKLPGPLFVSNAWGIFVESNTLEWGNFIYGLGYDCVGDDYKILKIGIRDHIGNELYSLKDNSWRKLEYYSSARPLWSEERCQFVDGIFYWIGNNNITGDYIIVSFDLSVEKYGEVALPHDSVLCECDHILGVTVVRGMLCVYGNYDNSRARFVAWVMEEYGVEKSWTKKFDIHIPNQDYCVCLHLLYLYDNNDILIKVHDDIRNETEIVLYKNHEEASPITRIVRSSCDRLYINGDAFLYTESLISPKPKPKPNANNE